MQNPAGARNSDVRLCSRQVGCVVVIRQLPDEQTFALMSRKGLKHAEGGKDAYHMAKHGIRLAAVDSSFIQAQLKSAIEVSACT